MSDISPTTHERLLETLRQRERLLEQDAACVAAKLEEVRDVIAMLTSRPRGRPRAVRAGEPAPMPDLLPDPPEAA